MKTIRNKWMRGLLLTFILAMFASVSTSAFANSTTFTIPGNWGTPNTSSNPYVYYYTPNGDEFFNWIEPAGTTHYSFAINHSGGGYFPGLLPGNLGHHFMDSTVWSTIPHNEVMQITINTYQYVSGTGYVHNGSDYAYIIVY